MFSWHGNIGREEMPRLLVLARRRGTADKQAWSSVLTAALDSFHLASAAKAQRHLKRTVLQTVGQERAVPR